MASTDVLFVSIGDLLSLRSSEDCRIASEGFFDNESFLSDESHDRTRARQSVFRIRHSHSYKVMTRLRKKLDKIGKSITEAQTEVTGTAGDIPELLRELEREEQRNEREFEQMRGRAVLYGGIVQLQHESTLKHLMVSRREAEGAAGRILVLERDAGELSWFRLLPRLRVHSLGERIHYGDPLLLEHVATGLRLCVGPARVWLGRAAVIASKDADAFKMERYRGWREEGVNVGTASKENRATNKGQPVNLVHKETEGKLGGQHAAAHLYRESRGVPSTSLCLWELLKADEATGEAEHDGGVCRWNETFKLLHLPTGQMLAAGQTMAEQSDESDDGALLRLAHESETHGPHTLWQLVPLYVDDVATTLEADTYFFLRHVATGHWLHVEVAAAGSAAKPTQLGAQGELELLNVILSETRHDEDVFGVLAAPRQQAEDVLWSRCCLKRFESFATQFGGLHAEPLDAAPAPRFIPSAAIASASAVSTSAVPVSTGAPSAASTSSAVSAASISAATTTSANIPAANICSTNTVIAPTIASTLRPSTLARAVTTSMPTTAVAAAAAAAASSSAAISSALLAPSALASASLASVASAATAVSTSIATTFISTAPATSVAPVAVPSLPSSTAAAPLTLGGATSFFEELEVDWGDASETLQALITWIEGDVLASLRRQNLLRELKLLDMAVAIGQAPLQSQRFKLDQIATRELISSSEESQSLHTTLLLSWKFVSCALKGNTANRLHAVRQGYVPLMQSQLGYSLNVAATLVQVYSENELLLDSVEDQTISTFVELIRSPGGRQGRYVDFFLVLCRVGDLAVRTNQVRSPPSPTRPSPQPPHLNPPGPTSFHPILPPPLPPLHPTSGGCTAC